jgi:hypothetical protein
MTEREEKFEALIEQFRGDRGSDPPRHGHGDAQLPGRSVRRRGGV